jgi:formate dehydrogenase subunit gamma
MIATTFARHLRLAAVLLAALFLFGAAPVLAQSSPPEPTRGGNNAEMWRSVRQGTQGYVSIPNKQAGVLVQSEGEAWRNLRNGPLSTYGSWLLLGTIVVLALFFAIRGRIRIESGWSGRMIIRFGAFERFVHWLTAVSFILLALTGLNVLYGRYVLLPILGPAAFSGLTLACKYVHNFTSFAFMLGILLMFVMWLRHNLPTRADLKWLARGGGLFTRGSHPPAYKFNAGQKLIFWAVVLLGALLSVSGLLLLFPLWWADLHETQLAQLGHAVLAMFMIAVIIAHIYIGTLGMEGAFSAMGTGLVDENWAREHHGLWVAEMKGEPPPTDDHAPREPVGGRRAARPA